MLLPTPQFWPSPPPHSQWVSCMCTLQEWLLPHKGWMIVASVLQHTFLSQLHQKFNWVFFQLSGSDDLAAKINLGNILCSLGQKLTCRGVSRPAILLEIFILLHTTIMVNSENVTAKLLLSSVSHCVLLSFRLGGLWRYELNCGTNLDWQSAVCVTGSRSGWVVNTLCNIPPFPGCAAILKYNTNCSPAQNATLLFLNSWDCKEERRSGNV